SCSTARKWYAPPGATIAAAPVARSGVGRYGVSVGWTTLRTIVTCGSPKGSGGSSSCVQSSVPGGAPSQREITVIGGERNSTTRRAVHRPLDVSVSAGPFQRVYGGGGRGLVHQRPHVRRRPHR